MSTPVDQIKEKLSIVDVVSSYIKLDRAGIYFKAKCPFHNERTPSFMISPARNNYHCFGCGKGGDIFSFVQEIEGLDFPSALRLLAERAGVVLDQNAKRDGGEKAMLFDILESATKFYEAELRKSKIAIEYLKERGITGETAKTFRLGFAPDGWENLVSFLRTKGWRENLIEKAGLSVTGKKSPYDRFRNRIMFPIASSQGKTVGFTGRVLPGADENSPNSMGKYVNSPETDLYHKSSVLYGLNLAKSEILREGKVIVVEGQMDALMVHQAGNKNVVAVSGTALTEEHLKILKRFTDNVVFCFDNDKAGQNALLKASSLAFAIGLEVKVINLNLNSQEKNNTETKEAEKKSAKDPADVIKENPEVWQKALVGAELVIDYLIKIIKTDQNDSREQIKKVKAEILPLVAVLSGNMDQSYYVKKISEAFDISENSVREDLKKTIQTVQANQNSNSKNENEISASENSPPKTRTAKTEAIERLIGFEKVFHDKLDYEKIRKKFSEIVGVTIEEFTEKLPSEKISSLTLEAELYYNESQKLEMVADELLATLELAHFEELLAENLKEMKIAEQAKDEKKASELYSQLKNLTEEIYKIKSNRHLTEI